MEIVGHENAVEYGRLLAFLSTSCGREKCCICVRGPRGCGKSTFVESALRDTRCVVHRWIPTGSSESSAGAMYTATIGVDAYWGTVTHNTHNTHDRSGGAFGDDVIKLPTTTRPALEPPRTSTKATVAVVLVDNLHAIVREDRGFMASILRTMYAVKSACHKVRDCVRVLITVDDHELAREGKCRARLENAMRDLEGVEFAFSHPCAEDTLNFMVRKMVEACRLSRRSGHLAHLAHLAHLSHLSSTSASEHEDAAPAPARDMEQDEFDSAGVSSIGISAVESAGRGGMMVANEMLLSRRCDMVATSVKAAGGYDTLEEACDAYMRGIPGADWSCGVRKAATLLSRDVDEGHGASIIIRHFSAPSDVAVDGVESDNARQKQIGSVFVCDAGFRTSVLDYDEIENRVVAEGSGGGDEEGSATSRGFRKCSIPFDAPQNATDENERAVAIVDAFVTSRRLMCREDDVTTTAIDIGRCLVVQNMLAASRCS